ncbi:MAG TPA: septum formation initiator family protein [Candidatus Marinimicrobia bacterium]|nr:septum formation initiator family protein [Candidatus Neomarinimicrobiota bacterium]
MNKVKANLEQRARISFQMLVLGIIIAIVMLFISDYGFLHYWKLNGENRQLRSKIEKLHEQELELEQLKGRLEHDTAYLEKLAREKYRMAKKNEDIYRVIDKANP